jgi:hypothetical protein
VVIVEPIYLVQALAYSGGPPYYELFTTREDADASARRYNDKDLWVADVITVPWEFQNIPGIPELVARLRQRDEVTERTE